MMRKFSIKNKSIDQDTDCYIIAEIGHNHQGSLDKCLNIIEKAINSGVSAIKLQKRSNKNLFTKNFYDQSYNSENAFGKTYGEHRENLEFDKQQFLKIKTLCNEKNIDFICTAFDMESLDFLIDIKIDAIKFASADLTNTPLLEYGASKGAPLIISTGGATKSDIDRAVLKINKYHNNLSILQCTALYPCEAGSLNLRTIEYYLESYRSNIIGLSSHHNGIAMDLVAYVIGARIIEKHFTLDRTMKGSDHSFSLEPHGMEKLVRDLGRAKVALGTKDKIIFKNELRSLTKMKKKIVAKRDLEKGTILTLDDIDFKSPGDGIEPYQYEEIIGKKITKNINQDDNIVFEILDI